MWERYLEEVPKHLSLVQFGEKASCKGTKAYCRVVYCRASTCCFDQASSLSNHWNGSPATPSHGATLRIPAWTWIFWYSVVRRSIQVSYLHSLAQRQPGNSWSSFSSGGMKGSFGPQAGRSCQPLFCPWRLKHKQPSTERTDPPETKTTSCYCSSFLIGLVPTTPKF